MTTNVAEQYLEARVMTAPPEELHLMVIDGAMRHATQAVAALEQRDFELSHRALCLAREFVLELIAGLNDDEQSEVVQQLKDVFGFAYRRLNEADLERNPAFVHDALEVLRIHRETWQEVMAANEARESSTPDAGARFDSNDI